MITRKSVRPIAFGMFVAVGCAAVALFAQKGVNAADATGTIGGVVTSTSGPEAGVWVIAETDDLQTKFRKIVVTDG